MRNFLIVVLLAGCASEGATAQAHWQQVDGSQEDRDAGTAVGNDAQPPGEDAAPADKPDVQQVEKDAAAIDVPAVQPDVPPVDAKPLPPPDCGETCKALGWCTPVGQTCEATKDADCAAAWCCETEGRCTAKDGKCVVASDKASDEGCHTLPGCKAKGLCTWNAAKGACVAYWVKDCTEADVCKQSGKCSTGGGVCCEVAYNNKCQK